MNIHRKFISRQKNILAGVVIFNLLFFLVLIIKGEPVFATNDDYRMRLIISGAYTGEPSSQAVFINSILAGGLSCLYRILPRIEWYGLFVMVSMFIPTCMIEYVLLNSVKGKWDCALKIAAIFVYSSLILVKHILMPQFTITAAYWCAAALVSLITYLVCSRLPGKKQSQKLWLILFVLSSTLALMIRKKMFIMCVPLLCAYIICFLIWEKKANKKCIIRAVVWTMVICAGVSVGNVLLNNSQDYRSFSEFNKARSKIYDYSGIADYNSEQEFYNSVGISRSAWNNLNGRTFDMNEELETENLLKVYEYTKEINRTGLLEKIITAVDESLKILISNTVFRQIMGVLLLVCLLFIKREKRTNSKIVFCITLTALYLFACIVFLAFTGRIMDRIVEALLIMFVAVIFSMTEKNSVESVTSRTPLLVIKKIKITDFMSIVFGVAVTICILVISNLYWLQNDSSAIRSVLWKQTNKLLALEEYMSEYPDSFLFYNALDFISASDYVFENIRGEAINIDSLGNWNVHSPTYVARNKKYGFYSAEEGIEQCENVYYAELGEYHACIDETLKQNGKMLELKDVIEVEDDIICIYRCIDFSEED